MSAEILHQEAAADVDHLAGHIIGIRAAEERHDVGNVLGLAAALQRDQLQEELLGLVREVFSHVGHDVAGGDRVHHDGAAAEFLRHGLRDADDAGLGG